MGDISDRFAVSLAKNMVRYRWLVIAAAIFLMVATGAGGRFLDFSTNYRVFFSENNPELTAFESFQNTYTKSDNILFVLKPANGEIFTPEMTDAIERLTEQAWQIPYAIRVDSVSNFQYSWAEDDDLTVEDLITDGLSLSESELAAKKQTALAEPLILNNLLSADAATTGINVTLQYPEQSVSEVPEAVSIAREIAEAFKVEFPELKIALSGVSMLNNAFAEAGEQDFMTLVPAMYLILIVIMVIALRSTAGTLATVVIIFFSTVVAMGMAGYLGIKLTPISVTAPTIILTLAIADSVHILVSMFASMREGNGKVDALIESLRINFLPVTITSITTIVGFLSLNFSDAPPFWHLGNITAMGIAAAWLFSMTLLPALVAVMPIKPSGQKAGGLKLERSIDRFADWVTGNFKKILIVGVSLSLILAGLIATLQLNDEFVNYFDERVQFRLDADFANEHLNGPYIIEYSVESGEEGGISNPDYLAHLDRFTNWVEQQPNVSHVYSYTDIVKRLNKNLHGDDESWYRIPDDRELAAQYLLLYELSLPYGLDLNDRINVDKSATRVSVNLENVSTVEIRELLNRTEEWLKNNVPEAMQAKPTGVSVMFSYISQRNIESMFKGNVLAIASIALILIIALRSWKLGLLSIIPNTLPVLITFGIWALLVGHVGMAGATITATSLGIVVDDTVHFLSKYLRARREKGLDVPDAIRYAFHTVGVAILATTLILTVGFAVLMYSTFLINFQMGLLTAMTIVVALLFDFLVLPALLMVGAKRSSAESIDELTLAVKTAKVSEV